jgi:hypothetical protein
LISICGCSCKEDPPTPAEPTLPPVTQTGENTFGCFVNGELWLPKGNIQTPALNGDYYQQYIQINANRVGQNPFSAIHLDFGTVTSDTSFIIHNYLDTTSLQYFYYNSSYLSQSGPIQDFYAILPNSGQLTLIKLDTVNRIMAGTFFFTAVDTVNNDTVMIEDGRFDIHY